MSHDWLYCPILSADISAMNLAVELVLILPRKSADFIVRILSVLGYLCANFISFTDSIAELAHGEKSRTQSITHSLI